ncbi:MAG: methionine--tRNA ligase [Myxococcales bacterium]|nr:methionine--tRNA ligase [Myxococcales bacterium]
MPQHFYLTTPIYYPNAPPHLGSAYTTTYADTLVRYHRARGEETLFLTGTDEHGEKIAQAAEAEGLTPQQFVDRISPQFNATWQELGLTPNRFIRTTDDDHIRATQHFWQQLQERGEIEFKDYTGSYCVGCEVFLTERELVDGKCPQHLVEPEERTESNYFFRMSSHLDWWIDELRRNPELVTPNRFRNEALALLESGALGDLCISRPRERLEWGIPLPFDEKFVLYVWCDALVNYLTGAGYPDQDGWKERWGTVHHLTAKDILKPHAIFWPTMLHAAGLPLYRGLHVHGYWNLGSQKISKSLGNLVDALAVKDKYGFDALRYYMLRELPFGLDGEFSEEAVVARYNADLANDLGNLLSRSLGMVGRYCDGEVPEPVGEGGDLRAAAERAASEVDDAIEAFSLRDALIALWGLVSAANKYIDRQAPWKLAREPAERERLQTVLYEILEALRVIAVLVEPFLPEAGPRILAALGAAPHEGTLSRDLAWGQLSPGSATRPGEPLFPRIESE